MTCLYIVHWSQAAGDFFSFDNMGRGQALRITIFWTLFRIKSLILLFILCNTPVVIRFRPENDHASRSILPCLKHRFVPSPGGGTGDLLADPLHRRVRPRGLRCGWHDVLPATQGLYIHGTPYQIGFKLGMWLRQY